MINILIFCVIAGIPIFLLYRYLYGGKAKADTTQQANGLVVGRQQQFEQAEGDGEYEDEGDPLDFAPRRLTKRQQNLMARKQEKQDRKQEMRMYIEQREKEKRERREKEEEEQEKREAEKLEEEEKKKEQEEKEYNKWKNMFGVEDEGELQQDNQELEKQKQEIAEYVKSKKLFDLEELGFQFNLSVEVSGERQDQEVVQKLKELESQGKILGVLDERGKYLSVDIKELEVSRIERQEIGKFIEERGKVSRGALVKRINQIIQVAA